MSVGQSEVLGKLSVGRAEAIEISGDDLHDTRQVIAQCQDAFFDLFLRHQVQQFAVIFLGSLAQSHCLKVEA